MYNLSFRMYGEITNLAVWRIKLTPNNYEVNRLTNELMSSKDS